MDHCEALLPPYLRFITGVVDAQDLSLNVSREILQNDRHLVMIRKRLVKRVLQTITAMRDNEREKYETFWTAFGAVLKEGLLDDQENRETLLGASSFASTFSEDGTTGLAEYVSRMPEAQDVIYYAVGESRRQLESSPHLEAFAAKGFEVLLLTDQVDELWTTGAEFDGKRFVSVAKGEADLGGDAPEAEGFESLTAWLAKTLEDKVSGVRLTSRLTSSPACLVGGEFDLSPQLEQMYRASGQEVPRTRRTLELNPDNALVLALREKVGDGEPADDLQDAAEILYGTAVLAEGGAVDDPAEFAAVLARQLARNLG